MHDEIFTFESFINFVIFKNISKPLLEIFIEIFYFNYNSPVTRKNVSQVQQQTKGQWLEKQHNDNYLYFVTRFNI